MTAGGGARTAPDAAAAVAESLGLVVVDILPGGEHGAASVRDGAGRRLVLKIFPEEKGQVVQVGARVARCLRDRGVGVPDPYRAGASAGHAYVVQGLCRGSVPVPLKLVHAEQLARWWECQLGACPEGGSWPEDVSRALTVGDSGLWAEHGPIVEAAERECGNSVTARAAAQLLGEIREVGSAVDPTRLTRGDALHTDFHHANVLVSGDDVVAIVDWDAARPGDARYDLVILSFWAEVHRGGQVEPEAAEYIARLYADRVAPDIGGWLSALYALHQLWYGTVHRPGDLPQMIGHIAEHLRPSWSSLL